MPLQMLEIGSLLLACLKCVFLIEVSKKFQTCIVKLFSNHQFYICQWIVFATMNNKIKIYIIKINNFFTFQNSELENSQVTDSEFGTILNDFGNFRTNFCSSNLFSPARFVSSSFDLIVLYFHSFFLSFPFHISFSFDSFIFFHIFLVFHLFIFVFPHFLNIT